MPPIKIISESITAPKGFQAAGVFCDVKRLGTGKGSDKGKKLDLALIVSVKPAAVAGMFTTNQICAAPVKVSIPRANQMRARAVVVNSGNANACTGERGLKDAREMAALTAKGLGVDENDVLVCSTGRIGLNLPMPNIRAGIRRSLAELSPSRDSAGHAAEAILTSDTVRKEYAVEFPLAGKTVRIGGIAKGAGMIAPGMSPNGKAPASLPLHATMLCFLTTDAAIKPSVLKKVLRESVARSFNRISIDGDMSTNDSVIILANGLAGNATIDRLDAPEGRLFQTALNQVTSELARMMVRDGEGVLRTVNVNVAGARSNAQAEAAARSISESQLVKTSWCGGDPNWGRIMAALGYSSAKVIEEKVDIGYSLPANQRIVYSLKRGKPTRVSFKTLCDLVVHPEFNLHIDLNLGQGAATLYSSDLTEAYVEFNKGDVSDPQSLGG